MVDYGTNILLDQRFILRRSSPLKKCLPGKIRSVRSLPTGLFAHFPYKERWCEVWAAQCAVSRILLLHMQERVQTLILRRAFCFLEG